MKSKYDPKGKSLKEGDTAESLFKKVAEQHGYSHEESPPAYNIHKHIDCYLEKDGVVKSFDIKSLKRVARENSYFQNEEIWIEFKNVRGRKGWLYGEADMIAFQDCPDSFMVFLRTDLVDFCEKTVDLETSVSTTKEALYKAYTRKDRKDVISRIKRKDLVKVHEPRILKLKL